jgi:hypothetical protein
MNTKGVNFQPSKRGQFSAAVDKLGRNDVGCRRHSALVGVGIEPSGYGVGVAASGNFRGARLSATER